MDTTFWKFIQEQIKRQGTVVVLLCAAIFYFYQDNGKIKTELKESRIEQKECAASVDMIYTTLLISTTDAVKQNTEAYKKIAWLIDTQNNSMDEQTRAIQALPQGKKKNK